MISMRHRTPVAGERVMQADLAAWREKLLDTRAKLICALACEFSGGNLALLGSVGSALAALDAMPAEPAGDPGD